MAHSESLLVFSFLCLSFRDRQELPLLSIIEPLFSLARILSLLFVLCLSQSEGALNEPPKRGTKSLYFRAPARYGMARGVV